MAWACFVNLCRSIKCCTREEEDRKAWENRDGCIKGGYIKRNGLSGEEVQPST